MNNKVFSVVIGLVAVVILGLAMPAITDSVESFRTDILEQSYSVDTTVGANSANVSLSSALWNDNIAYVTSLSSNITSDAPVAASYNATSAVLLITGLADNTSRTITLSYKTAGLADYEGADTASTKLPGIVMGFLILIPLGFIVYLFMNR